MCTRSESTVCPTCQSNLEFYFHENCIIVRQKLWYPLGKKFYLLPPTERLKRLPSVFISLCEDSVQVPQTEEESKHSTFLLWQAPSGLHLIFTSLVFSHHDNLSTNYVRSVKLRVWETKRITYSTVFEPFCIKLSENRISPGCVSLLEVKNLHISSFSSSFNIFYLKR